MIEQGIDTFTALHAATAGDLSVYPSFLREKAQAMRVVASESRMSFVDYFKNHAARKAAKGHKTAKQVGLGAANTAFLYGDDALLLTAYEKVGQMLPDTAGKVALAGLIAVVSGGFNRFLARQNQKHLSFASPAPAAEVAVPADVGRIEALKNQYRRTRDQLGLLAVSLAIGVPANAMTTELSDRQVNVHSAIYGTVAAGAYAGVTAIGLLDNPVAYGTVLGGIVGSRYVGHVFDRGGVRSTDDMAAALTLPTPQPQPVDVPVMPTMPTQVAGS